MRVEEFANEHVAAFNRAVASRDFASFLTRFDDDALVRFENVPGAGVIQLAGRQAFTAGYQERPPDDQIRISGPVRHQGRAVVIPFTWMSNDSTGVLRLTLR